MMIENFQISPDLYYEGTYIDVDGEDRITLLFTGFMHACNNNNVKLVQLLIEKYPSIIN